MKMCHSFQSDYALQAFGDSRHLWDNPIFESDSFVVLPTVGALVEGWLLVVPRIPFMSFGQLPEQLFSEFEEFLSKVAQTVEEAYGPFSVFEHGAAVGSNPIGCGVDYAHMHLMPQKCDLLLAAQEIATNIDWQTISSVREIRNHADSQRGYWFVQQTFGITQPYLGLCKNNNPPSQLFRKAIANKLGRPLSFDWKAAAEEAVIAKTVNTLTQSSSLV
ncbi:MAG TPA: hypothetical protein VGC95_00575 [Chitinophagaceae bacterium]|jgi:diadenosine tetraphosphate (Ap4A) HIT family hydrolase